MKGWDLTRLILTGNQAVALGAVQARVKVVAGYPGTPSTGCIAHLLTMNLPERTVEWSTNEKVAFEVASGAAWAGQRALATMKMSGVNVAYDALISIAYSGTNGGLVIYVADDPGVSAGMPEQDSRGFALMSDLPMLEPASVADAYRLTQAAFELSEAASTPVFLRLTTAVALGHAIVDLDPTVPPPPARDVVLEKNITRYTKAGSKICKDQHAALIERLDTAGEWISEAGLNRLELSDAPGGLGIVSVGAVNAYLNEGLDAARSAGHQVGEVSILRAVATTPFPIEEVKDLLTRCDTVLVLEELEPHMERAVTVAAHHWGFDGPIVGKLDGTLSRIGEYGVAEVRKALAACSTQLVNRGEAGDASASMTVPAAKAGESVTILPRAHLATPRSDSGDLLPGCPPSAATLTGEPSKTVLSSTDLAAPRPITVCAGCPHRGSYLAIEAAIKQAGFAKDEVMVTGDIGCTILGMNPPFNLLWTEVSMGSSIGLAQGYVHAGIATPVIATIGDSTFFHGGIPGLLNAIQHGTPLTLVIMDNGWTSMTGMQVNPGTDAEFQPEGGRRIDLVKVVEGLGPDRIEVVDPYDVPSMTDVLAGCLTSDGVKVVVAQQECAIQARRRGVAVGTVAVDPDKCILCKRCLKVTGCPALSVLPNAPTELGETVEDLTVSLGSGSNVPTEQAPREQEPEGSGTPRGSIAIDPLLCNGCGICVETCPTNALVRVGSGTKGDAK